MPLLTIEHPDVSQSNRTFLDADVASGQTSLTVSNNAGFAVNNFIVLAALGSEGAELLTIQSKSGNTGITTTTNTKFDHEDGAPIVQLPWNKVRIYRAASEGGSYSLIDTIDLQVDYRDFTRYNDTAGNSTSWYKIAYFDSVASLEGPLSDPIQANGFKDRSLGTMRERVRKFADANDKDSWPDEIIDTEINEEQRQLQSQNWPFTEASATFGLTADDDTYDISSDLLVTDLDRAFVLRDTDGTDIQEVAYIDPKRFFELKGTTTDTDRRPTAYTIWDGKIYFLQTPSTTRASSHTFFYWKKLATLDSQNDVTDVTHPDVLVFGTAKRISMMKGDVNRANMNASMQKIAMEAMNAANKSKSNTGFGKVRRTRVGIYTDEASYAAQRMTLTGA